MEHGHGIELQRILTGIGPRDPGMAAIPRREKPMGSYLVLQKIPTGIKTFDPNIKGGFPAGSLILLLEDVGAGAREFIYTSIYNLLQLKASPEKFKALKEKHEKTYSGAGMLPSTLILPLDICYLSLSKSKDDILREIAYSFHKDYINTVQNGIVFHDLTDTYFDASLIKNIWITGKMSLESKDDRTLISKITGILEEDAPGNMVVIDSLTEMITCDSEYIQQNDIVMLLKGMQQIAKKWNGIVYIILSANILGRRTQELITDVVDGVLIFEWSGKGSVKMRRGLYISKFRGLMPQLEQEYIAKFETKITAEGGFEVSNVRRIA